ncbi:hypothetical protein KGQ20_41380 [Catenulispora sp. NF23]|nr:hypothetical protein [Catenulispora pinistramenti]MBS2539218.1 hypothetical protein [Catenulispora pinistramenti]
MTYHTRPDLDSQRSPQPDQAATSPALTQTYLVGFLEQDQESPFKK